MGQSMPKKRQPAATRLDDARARMYRDLIFGAAGSPSTTKTYVLFGAKDGDPTVGLQFTSPDSLDLFGKAVAAAGDLNGDGKADLLIGAPYSADVSTLSRLKEARQIQYAALPIGLGNSSASTFTGTTASGIDPRQPGNQITAAC